MEGKTVVAFLLPIWILQLTLLQGTKQDDSSTTQPTTHVESKTDSAVSKEDLHMIKPDPAVIKPDTAVIKPDTAVIKPDTAVIKPDTAVIKPVPTEKNSGIKNKTLIDHEVIPALKPGIKNKTLIDHELIPALKPGIKNKTLTDHKVIPASKPKPLLWLARIHHNHSPICFGSLIHQQWVLSAAHCFSNDLNAAKYEVLLNDSHSPSGLRKVSVEQIIIHPNYNHTHQGDIALLKLASPLTNHQLIRLPEFSTQLLRGGRCFVPSWKTAPEGGNVKQLSTLYNLTVVLIDHVNCNLLIQQSCQQNNLIKEYSVCARCSEDRHASCQVDSSAPLVCEHNGGLTQVGISSWRLQCAATFQSYTSVPFYAKWIQDEKDSAEMINTPWVTFLLASLALLTVL